MRTASGKRSGILGLVGYGSALQAINILVQLIITALLAQQLGLSAFGEYVLIIAIITLTGVLTVFGLPTYLTREIAASLSQSPADKYDPNPMQYFVNALATTLAVFAIAVVFLVLLDAISPSLPSGLIGAIPLSIILGRSVLEINAGALAGLSKIRQSQTTLLLLLNVPFLTLLAIAHYLLSWSMSIELALLLQTLGIWIGAAISGVWVWRETKKYQGKWIPLASWFPALRDCIPLVMVNGLASIQQNIVLLLLGAFLSNADVGIFRIAQRCSSVAQFLRSALTTILQPKIAHHWRAKTLAGFAMSVRQLSVLNVLFNVVLIGGVALFGREILSTLFGKETVVALPSLLILLLGFALAAVFGFNGMILSMTSNAGRLLRILAYTLLILVLLLVGLIYVQGVLGAAIAIAVYNVLTGLLLWREVRRLVGIDISALSFRKWQRLGKL